MKVEQDKSLKVCVDTNKRIEKLLFFFKNRYPTSNRNFTKKGIMQNAVRVYTQLIQEEIQEKSPIKCQE